MKFTEYEMAESSGTPFHVRYWENPDLHKACLVLIHGLGEHAGRYEYLAGFFTLHGVTVLAPDLYGHGLTKGQRGHVRKMDDLLIQIGHCIHEAKRLNPGLPIILYGHSMGGLLSLVYASRVKDLPEALIVTSPALAPGFPVPALKVLLGKIGKAILPSLSQPNGLEVKYLSHDQSIIDKYVADPLVHDKLSAELGMGILEWGEWCRKNVHESTIPLLAVHGNEDKIISFSSSKHCFENMKGDVRFVEWEGGYHELHNEPFKDEVLQLIFDWMNQKCIKPLN